MLTDSFIESVLCSKTPEKVFDPIEFIGGKSVLVTGAGGYIGSALCDQISTTQPTVLVLVEKCEFALYEIARKLEDKFLGLRIVPVLCDYGDPHIRRVLARFNVDWVFHVGAYKHVPLCERNVSQAVKNNVLSSRKLFKYCREAGVSNLLVVSSDKAVNPTNVMGATKRVVEELSKGVGKSWVVRFGNVLGSTGSVIPLFYEQLSEGKEVTITSPHVDRYFMTVHQAVTLILQSVCMQNGTYTFDMGDPVNIEQLARKMAECMGVDFKHRYVGLRPGEKLHEELTMGVGLESTKHPQILRANEPSVDATVLRPLIQHLTRKVKENDVPGVLMYLKSIVAGYNPSLKVDDVWLEDTPVIPPDRFDDCYKVPRI